MPERKGPSASATGFPVGTTQRGNDGEMWTVVATKAGVQRWQRGVVTLAGAAARPKGQRKGPTPSAIFDVIYTFTGLEQVFLELKVARGISEDEFIRAALRKLKLTELKQLIKVSASQKGVTRAESEPWILRRNGKFFFNDEVNRDEDSQHWAAVRARAIKAHAAKAASPKAHAAKSASSKARKGPTPSATTFNEGARRRGNDGRMWVVRVARNGSQRWVPVTPASAKG